MQDHLPKARRTPSPSPRAPGAARLPAPRAGRERGAAERIADSTRICSTCREDLAVPGLNYRLVLRCSTTGLDH